MLKQAKGRYKKKIVGIWCPSDIFFDSKQFWMLMFLSSMFIVLGFDVTDHINPSYYLNFLTFLGSFFVGGQHLLEWLKSNQNKTDTENENKNDQSVNVDEKAQIDINQVVVHRDPKDFSVSYPDLQKFKKTQ